MPDDNRQPNEPMDRLLRRWGADEAARRETAAAPPVPATRRAPRRRALAPWLAAAAGFLFFAAGAALFTATWLDAPLHQAEAPPVPLGPSAPGPDLRAELDGALDDLADARAALEKAGTDLADRERRLAAFRQLHEDLQARYRSLQESDKAAKAEAADLRKERDDLLADRPKTEEQLKALQAQRSALVRLWREASRPADVSLEAGVEALRKIARDGGLLRRGAALRDRIRDATLRQIFDTQEVLLTQLDLLNVDDPAEVQAFARRVRAFEEDLGPLDRLGTAETDPAVRAWLLETRLLLGEVKHEG